MNSRPTEGGLNFEAVGEPGDVRGVLPTTRSAGSRVIGVSAISASRGGARPRFRGRERRVAHTAASLQERQGRCAREDPCVGNYQQASEMPQLPCDPRVLRDVESSNSAKMRAGAPPIHLRATFSITLKPNRQADAIDEVREASKSSGRRFVTHEPRALSPERTRTLNVAMNRIGAKSDSGEGGEDHSAHFHARAQRRQPPRRSSRWPQGRFRGDGGIPQPVRETGDQESRRARNPARRPASGHEA